MKILKSFIMNEINDIWSIGVNDQHRNLVCFRWEFNSPIDLQKALVIQCRDDGLRSHKV